MPILEGPNSKYSYGTLNRVVTDEAVIHTWVRRNYTEREVLLGKMVDVSKKQPALYDQEKSSVEKYASSSIILKGKDAKSPPFEFGRIGIVNSPANRPYLDIDSEFIKAEQNSYTSTDKLKTNTDTLFSEKDGHRGHDRSLLKKESFEKYYPNKWWEDPFSLADHLTGISENDNSKSDFQIDIPKQFKNKFVDRISGFDTSTDVLKINKISFDISSVSSFKVGKNKKAVKKLAMKNFNFLYDEKKGGLYFNENSADKGFGDGGIIAILKGAPGLTAGNLEFI